MLIGGEERVPLMTHHQASPINVEDGSSRQLSSLSNISSYIKIRFDDVDKRPTFAKPPTKDFLAQRNRDQYPFVSVDYYISKANTLVVDNDIENITSVLRFQYDYHGLKPIIFIPSEYLLTYLPNLITLNITFSLITVSNEPFCVPYVVYPPLCDSYPHMRILCDQVDALLSSPYLDKWFTKNPCMLHPKVHPLPIGPKWQWKGKSFLDDDRMVTTTNKIFRYYGLKPFALLHNYTHLLYDTSHDTDGFQYLQKEHPSGDEQRDDLMRIQRSMIAKRDHFLNFVDGMRDSNPESWFLSADGQLFPGKDRLLYFNFDLNTTISTWYSDHTAIRQEAYRNLLDQGFQPSPVRQISGYLQDLSEHKFCISPPGVGLDAHRTWEALMVGTIPIVLSSPLNPLYEGLPVIMVKSFSSISRESLDIAYEIVKANLAGYDFSKLYVDYWDQVIT